MDTLKKGNPLLAVCACLLPLPTLQDSRLSGPKPSLSHKALLVCSSCFLDNQSSVFVVSPCFVLPRFLWTPPLAAAFVFAPLFSK